MIKPKYFLSFIIGTLLYSCVFSQIDTPPRPYGGSTLMKEFICNEMIYPPAALKEKIQGTVEVSITVMIDGKAVNHHITKAVHPDLDAEALRISRLLLFYPATKNGSNIIETVTIPVKFNIKKYKRNCKNIGLDDFEQYTGPADSSLKIYATRAVEQAPRPFFKDPDMNFGKYINQNLKYPEIAYKQNITGDVELSFVVETSGRISNIEVINPLGGGCTEEAISLINQLLWNPGICKGKAVRTSLSAKISFNLDNNSNHQYLPNNTNTTM